MVWQMMDLCQINLIEFIGIHSLISIPLFRLGLTWIFLAVFLFSLSLQAEEDETGALILSQKLSLMQIQARMSELETSVELDQASRAALELFRSAFNRLKASQEDKEAVARYRQSIDTAAKQKELLAKSLQQARDLGKKPLSLPQNPTLDALSQWLGQAEADQKLAQTRLSELIVTLASERARPEQTGLELAEVRFRLSEVENSIGSPEVLGESALTAEARRTSMLTNQQALMSRINRLEMERLSYGPRMEQLNARINFAREASKQAESRVQALQELMNERRAAEADRAIQDAAQAWLEASGKHQLIQSSLEENATLSGQLSALAVEIEKAARDRQRVVGKMALINYNLGRVKQQLDITGLDDELLGQVLRSQRKELPDVTQLHLSLEEEQRRLAGLRLEQFRLEDQRQQLATDEQIALQLERVKPTDLTEQQWLVLTKELEKVYRDRFQLLEKLQAAYIRYEKLLSDLSLGQQSLGNKAGEYAALLDRNLIWIPSANPLNMDVIKETVGAIGWIFSGKNWGEVVWGISNGLAERPFRGALALILFVLVLSVRPSMRRDLEQMAAKVGNVSQDSFLLTLRASLYTLLLALPWVMLLAALGWMLIKSGVHPFSDAVGEGFRRSLTIFFVFQVIRYLLIPNGLAEVHFRWQPDVTALFRQHLYWLVPLLVTAVFIVGVTEWQDNEIYRNTLGRSVFIIGLLIFGFFTHLTLNPWSGAPDSMQREGRNGWGRGAFWYPLALMITLLLVLLSFEGYHYTAVKLGRLLLQSIAAGLLVFVLYYLAVRWLLVAERRLALARARAKRQAAQEAREAKEIAEAAGEGLPDTLDMKEINLATINEQTRRLLRVLALVAMMGLLVLVLVWSGLMPALGFLGDVVLWQHISLGVEGEQLTPISLVDVLLACLVLVLMVVAGRNLPGLLEIALLQPMAVDPGTRYTVSNISRYLIYATGTVTALALVGLAWDDVQWLVAAMGVGLGFGLKEIFANLISGIMILFERPIRIGDTVTVGDISGTVSRIRIRATTITDWDNKELVVPNKTFIIDPLINWTLSDPITRLVIKVGIAYGSDTKKAHQIMVDVITAHSDVLKEPNPTVFFVGFGDSSLDFEIRVFVRERLLRMPLTHDLHMALEAALRKADIEIPFPQRDLHLRSVDPAISTYMPSHN